MTEGGICYSAAAAAAYVLSGGLGVYQFAFLFFKWAFFVCLGFGECLVWV